MALDGGYAPADDGGDAAGGRAWTRSARSPSAAVEAAPAADAVQAALGVAGGGPPASWSAALPARPRPSTDLLASSSDPSGLDPAARLVLAAPVAHGGGAAQSRGGLRRTGGSSGGAAGGGPGRASSISSSFQADPAPTAAAPAIAPAPAAASSPERAASASRLGRLAPRPILERRADGKRARQAVRLLVSERARCRRRFGEAAMAVVGTRRARIAVVTERDERTGRGTVHAGQPSLSHRPR